MRDASSSVSRDQQTPSQCHQWWVSLTVRRHSVYNNWRSHHWQHAMKRDIGRKQRFFHTPPPFDALARGGVSSECCHSVWSGKTRMVWILGGEKVWGYDYSFWNKTRTWQTHGRTDRHLARAQAALMHSIARKKWNDVSWCMLTKDNDDDDDDHGVNRQLLSCQTMPPGSSQHTCWQWYRWHGIVINHATDSVLTSLRSA